MFFELYRTPTRSAKACTSGLCSLDAIARSSGSASGSTAAATIVGFDSSIAVANCSGVGITSGPISMKANRSPSRTRSESSRRNCCNAASESSAGAAVSMK